MKEAVALMNENSLGGKKIFFYITVFYLVISVWTLKESEQMQETDCKIQIGLSK